MKAGGGGLLEAGLRLLAVDLTPLVSFTISFLYFSFLSCGRHCKPYSATVNNCIHRGQVRHMIDRRGWKFNPNMRVQREEKLAP